MHQRLDRHFATNVRLLHSNALTMCPKRFLLLLFGLATCAAKSMSMPDRGFAPLYQVPPCQRWCWWHTFADTTVFCARS